MHAAEVFVLRVIMLAAIAAAVLFGVRWAMGQHDAAVVGNVTGAAQASARTAETSAAGQQQQAATQVLQTGVRAGQAISRASRVVPRPAAGQEQPMIGNDTLRNIVGQGR